MRNKKLFALISIIFILSLIFMACGKKPQVEEKEIDHKEIVAKEENIEETEDNNKRDGENLEETIEESGNLEETINRERQDNSTSNNSTSNKSISNKGNKIEEKKTNTSIEDKSSSSDEVKDNEPSVSIIIIGPEDVGTILETTEVELNDGETAFDIIKQVVKDNNIQMEYKGKKSNVYIQGIDNIYEFDKGPESGWIFRVNGEISQVSSGAYKLSDGDKIELIYTLDLGREFEEKGEGE